jgi:hypothetical protein
MRAMPIRHRIYQKYRVIPYHKEYGTLDKPPIKNGQWPNGAFVAHGKVPRHRGPPLIIGWTCCRHWIKTKVVEGMVQFQYGVWVANKKSWVTRTTPVAYANGFNPAKDFTYVGEAESGHEAMEMLREAWTERYNITLP